MSEFKPLSGFYQENQYTNEKLETTTAERIKYARQYVPKLHDIGEDNLTDYEQNDDVVDDVDDEDD